MIKLPFVLVVLLSAALAATPASAKGCLKGAGGGGGCRPLCGRSWGLGGSSGVFGRPSLREEPCTSLPHFAAVRGYGPNLLLGLPRSDQIRRRGAAPSRTIRKSSSGT